MADVFSGAPPSQYKPGCLQRQRTYQTMKRLINRTRSLQKKNECGKIKECVHKDLRLSLICAISCHLLWDQGWCSGESAHLPQMCPGFDSQTRRDMWSSLLVLYSAPRGFSLGTLVFPSPQKPTFDLI